MFEECTFITNSEAQEIVNGYHVRMRESKDRFYAIIVDATQDNCKVASLISTADGCFSKLRTAVFRYSELRCHIGNTVCFFKCGTSVQPLEVHANIGDGEFVSITH